VQRELLDQCRAQLIIIVHDQNLASRGHALDLCNASVARSRAFRPKRASVIARSCLAL
jgi:hypothetical protein